jgi:hypothetical protein
LEQPGSFRFDLQKFRNKQFVSFSIFLYFGLDSFFASILTSYRLILFVSLRYLIFSRTKLRFRFDLASEAERVISEVIRKITEAARLFVEAVRVLVEAVRVIVEG